MNHDTVTKAFDSVIVVNEIVMTSTNCTIVSQEKYSWHSYDGLMTASVKTDHMWLWMRWQTKVNSLIIIAVMTCLYIVMDSFMFKLV